MSIDIITLGIQGPQGPAGAQGSQGPQGPPGSGSGGLTTTSISGNYTISSSETNTTQVFTGSLSADATITMPAVSGRTYQIRNNTTGGKKLKVKGAVGSQTVQIKNGRTRWVLTDATNAYAAGESATSLEINVCDAPFNAVGDFVADDTAAIQAAIDVFSGVTNDVSGTLIIPFGDYKITSTLTYTGANGKSFTMKGEAVARGAACTRLIWDGSVGGTLFISRGANYSQWKDIHFDAHLKAAKAFWAQSDQDTGGAGSSRIKFENCMFLNAVGAGSACFAQGFGADGLQCDSSHFNNCIFFGQDTLTEAGFKTFSAGNTKNFQFYGCDFSSSLRGCDLELMSGFALLSGCGFSGNWDTDLFLNDGGTCTILECEAESGNDSKLVDSSGSGSSGAGLTIIGGQFFKDRTASDDICINYPGKITLIGGEFFNYPAAGGLIAAHEFKIRAGDLTMDSPNCTSFTAIGCLFASPSTNIEIPIYNGSGQYCGPGDFATQHELNVFADGCSGGPGGSFLPIKPLRGAASRMQHFGPRSLLANSAVSAVTHAEGRTTTTRVTVLPAAWTAASTTQTLLLYIIAPKSKVTSVISETTTKFAGLAGTIQLKVGNDTALDQYILAHDVKTAAVIAGTADAELGAGLARATAIQGGDMSVYGTPSGSYLQLTLTSGSGNIGNGTVTNLTTGTVTINVTTEFLGPST